MFSQEKIPSTEPKIKVGVILPEDDQSTIKIGSDFPAILAINEEKIKLEHLSIEINVDQSHLICSTDNIQLSAESLIIQSVGPDSYFTLNAIRTGRDFHWEKMISVKLTNKLIFKLINGKLLLINELPLENYLACVATSEMSAECPESFIEAQTIAARSWMLANVEQKHLDLGIDVCNDDCCQRYQGINNLTVKAKRMAENSRGKVLMYNDTICDARYSKSCGGIMEKFENLWEPTPHPYLQVKMDGPPMELPNLTKEEHLKEWVNSDPHSFCSTHYIPEENLHRFLGKVDDKARYFRWNKEISQKKLLDNINDKLNLEATAIIDLIPLKRGGSGRMLELKVFYLDQNDKTASISVYKDYNARNVLHPDFLYSSACTIEKMEKDGRYPDFLYQGAGWGHGAGLCQIGALGMALHGYNTVDILYHYYPGSILKKIY